MASSRWKNADCLTHFFCARFATLPSHRELTSGAVVLNDQQHDGDHDTDEHEGF
jgi:hypothetical protein